LGEITKDYIEHVANKAFLSCDGRISTDRLVEYLVKEILEKEKLEALEEMIGGVVNELSEREKFLLELRYFRRKPFLLEGARVFRGRLGSRRSYPRKQERLLKKFGERLRLCGLSEKQFFKDYARIPCVGEVYGKLTERKTHSSTSS
jgi:hypothetical protein